MSNIETLLENANFNGVDFILSTMPYEKMPNRLIYAVLMTTVRFEKELLEWNNSLQIAKIIITNRGYDANLILIGLS
jgi:hypothetical protein